MTVEKNYEKLIKNCDEYIRQYQDENKTLSSNEDNNKKILEDFADKNWKYKRQIRKLKCLMDNFLRENGGFFSSLAEDQQKFYEKLLEKKNHLSLSYNDSKNSIYSLKSDITALKNRQISNYLTISMFCFDKMDYQREGYFQSQLKENLA